MFADVEVSEEDEALAVGCHVVVGLAPMRDKKVALAARRSRPELAEVVVEVLVHQPPPLVSGQASEEAVHHPVHA